jgi:hypothetical protein
MIRDLRKPSRFAPRYSAPLNMTGKKIALQMKMPIRSTALTTGLSFDR